MALLNDPYLCAMSAYLLGRSGFKGYPKRVRDATVVAAALHQHLADDTKFNDPFYRRTFRTQDFVLAAFVRVSGPERFRIDNTDLADMIGYGLPSFTDELRADLLEQALDLD